MRMQASPAVVVALEGAVSGLFRAEERSGGWTGNCLEVVYVPDPVAAPEALGPPAASATEICGLMPSAMLAVAITAGFGCRLSCDTSCAGKLLRHAAGIGLTARLVGPAPGRG